MTERAKSAKPLQTKPTILILYKDFVCYLPLTQDFANQIRFSQKYKEAVFAHGAPFGRFLAPAVGEHFSGKPRSFGRCQTSVFQVCFILTGLPDGWTSPVAGMCDPETVKKLFPPCEAWSVQSVLLSHSYSIVLFAGAEGAIRVVVHRRRRT